MSADTVIFHYGVSIKPSHPVHGNNQIFKNGACILHPRHRLSRYPNSTLVYIYKAPARFEKLFLHHIEEQKNFISLGANPMLMNIPNEWFYATLVDAIAFWHAMRQLYHVVVYAEGPIILTHCTKAVLHALVTIRLWQDGDFQHQDTKARHIWSILDIEIKATCTFADQLIVYDQSGDEGETTLNVFDSELNVIRQKTTANIYDFEWLRCNGEIIKRIRSRTDQT